MALDVEPRVERAAVAAHAAADARRPSMTRSQVAFWHAVLSLDGLPMKPLDDMVADFEASGIVTELQECP